MTRAEKAGLKDKLIFVAGGPRVTHPLALECGFDAGFGVGTKPSDVASYIVEEFLRRREQNEGIPNPLKSEDEPSEANTKKPKVSAKKSMKSKKPARKIEVKFGKAKKKASKKKKAKK
jgi:hypothetical protein